MSKQKRKIKGCKVINANPKHTEGPWLQLQLPGVEQGNAIIDDYENMLVAVIIPRHSGYTQSDANARLIASAPELLEILDLTTKALRNLVAKIPKDTLHKLNLDKQIFAEHRAQQIITKLT